MAWGTMKFRLYKQIYAYVRRFSIRNRLMLMFWGLTVLVVFVCAIASYSSLRSTVSLVSLNNSQMVSTATENLRSALGSLSAVTKYPILRPAEKATVTYEYLSDVGDISQNEFDLEFKNQCAVLFDQHPEIRQIFIFELDGEGIYLQSNKRYLYSTKMAGYGLGTRVDPEAAWFFQTVSQRGREFTWTAQALEGMGREEAGNPQYLYLSRSIFNTERFENVGLILASYDLSPILEDFAEKRNFECERIGMFRMDGERLYGSLEPEAFGKLVAEVGDRGSLNTVMRDGNLYTYSVLQGEYLCIVETPLAAILSETMRQQSGLLLLLLLLLLFLIFTTHVLVNSITRPISRLVKACERIRWGHRSVLLEDNAEDELAEFTRSFNHMANEIDSLIHEVYQKNLAHAQTELQMLREQINPHFLYNTLESIRSTARRRGELELEEMSFLLAKTLRYGVSQAEFVTVRQEMDHLQDYISLQILRYKSSIQFFVHVDEKVMDRQIIKLLLQPLVENALYHGINTLASGGTITVLGHGEQEGLVFQIIDNGVGIPADTLEQLNGYIRGENEHFRSIGIKNVHRRIQLYYGDGYGVRIDSQEGQGTMVTLRVPAANSSRNREGGAIQ